MPFSEHDTDQDLTDDDATTGKPARRILVVGPAQPGEMVAAQTLFKLLTLSGPCELDVLAPEVTHGLIERMPEVARRLTLPVAAKLGLGACWRLGQSLATVGYHQAIVLIDSYKVALIPAVAGIAIRTGFRGTLRYFLINDMRMVSRQRPPTPVQRFAMLGRAINQPLPDPLPAPDPALLAALDAETSHHATPR